MTNREYMNGLSNEDLAKVLDSDEWCIGKVCLPPRKCSECVLEWLEKQKQPKLENGLFVLVYYGSHYKLGIICNNNIVYQEGGFDLLDDVKSDIVEVHKGFSFRQCLTGKSEVIWKKEE